MNNQTDNSPDISKAIFTPTRFTNIAVAGLKRSEESSSRSLPFPIPQMSNYVAPVMPGQVMTVTAQTSNGKTTFLRFWQKQAAALLKETGRDNDEVIVRLDMETTIEDLAMMEVAEVAKISKRDLALGKVSDWKQVMEATRMINQMPIIRIGPTIGDNPDDRVHWDSLYISNMLQAMDLIINGQILKRPKKIAAIFVDYLQAFPLDPHTRNISAGMQQRRIQIRNDFYRIKEAGSLYDAPIVVAVQAKQALGKPFSKSMLIPHHYDIKESSDVPERTDRNISVWLPKMDYSPGTLVSSGDITFNVKENTYWIWVSKQRNGLPAGQAFHNEIDYETGRINFVPIHF